MGKIIANHLKARFNRDVLFMHGSIPSTARDEMVRSFQDVTPGSPSIFILTLKTGGNGLNLTAANHVIHYDRWWNPAVENQATDRTHRIGQERKVMVYKFICLGTIEEHIDKMITEKKALAENVLDQGDKWITEMDTDELKKIFTLRHDIITEVASDDCID
jgi:SNF2 family DNA or RNA helicase